MIPVNSMVPGHYYVLNGLHIYQDSLIYIDRYVGATSGGHIFSRAEVPDGTQGIRYETPMDLDRWPERDTLPECTIKGQHTEASSSIRNCVKAGMFTSLVSTIEGQTMVSTSVIPKYEKLQDVYDTLTPRELRYVFTVPSTCY